MRLASVIMLFCVPMAALTADKPVLPAEWHGEWTGEMVVYGPEGKTSKVPLTLTIQPRQGREGWSWKAVYGSAKPIIKDYQLLAGDRPGRFVIDEGAGLLLPARLDAGVLISTFAVGESVLTARYELSGRTLRFEVTSARKGGQPLPGGVQGYEVNAVQRAELTRGK